MKKYTIKAPSQMNASINLPASKSISNRALVISAMAGSSIQPSNLSDCDDTEVIIAALNNMPDVIDIKAAGTASRAMLLGFMADFTGSVLPAIPPLMCARQQRSAVRM